MTTDERADPAGRDAPIRVAFDAGFLALPPSGIGSYVAGLLVALGARDDVAVARLTPPRALRRLDPRLMRFAWDAVAVELARLATARGADVLHVPNISAPVASRVPLVVTIHDVIPFVQPEYRASGAMRLYLSLMERTVRRAKIVLTPSDFSAGEIERVLGIPRERIRVTPLAVDSALRPASDSEAVRCGLEERFGIRGRYLLHMAGFDRRKNVPMLVRAFARSLISLPDDVALVLAGAPHSDNPTVFPPIEPVIRELGVGDRMVLTGRVTDADRVLLYQGAEGYVTPSAYEGFGLTPLEAMACGVPVIVANRTSLPEVVGDAGLLVEPELEAVAEAIVRLVTDRELRADLSRRGFARASTFIWERTADLTVAAYREAHRLG
jgi:glycosyltransferase involved in cell wall biosynthesis